MKIVYVSNYFAQHQEELSLELSRRTEGQYRFIATEPFPPSRRSSGYVDLNHKYDFILRDYESHDQAALAKKLANECDVLMVGSAPTHYLIDRMEKDRLSVIYSERPFKKGTWRRFIPKTRKKVYDRFLRFRHQNVLVLCASSYTASDIALCGFPVEKCLKWGYFPEVRRYELGDLMAKKEHSDVELLWVARFLECKHPELPLEVIRRLSSEGHKARLTMIGDGELRSSMERKAQQLGVAQRVTFTGSIPTERVRDTMERSNIFLFTSDRMEGWGAVVNEAMNSGCAVVCSDAAGAGQYLIENEKNGMLYRYGDNDGLYERVLQLCRDSAACRAMGEQAYETITGTWCAPVAAERLCEVLEARIRGENITQMYEQGPCSPVRK